MCAALNHPPTLVLDKQARARTWRLSREEERRGRWLWVGGRWGRGRMCGEEGRREGGCVWGGWERGLWGRRNEGEREDVREEEGG